MNPNRQGFAAITYAILAVATDEHLLKVVFSVVAALFVVMMFLAEGWTQSRFGSAR